MSVVLIAGGGTGGHLMPALAIADALRRTGPELEPVLVGARRGVEARLLPTRDFRYHLLPTEPLYRRTWWRNWRWPLVAARLASELAGLFRRERPVAVVGTGGYASAPVVWWGARAGLPAAIQEQNAFPGLATRFLSRRVRHVYLGLPEARAHLTPGRRAEVFDTGNPIGPPDPARRAAALARFGLSGARPVLLVTGGSQGSLAVNRAVAAGLDAGRYGGVDLLWVTGRTTYAEFAPRHRPPAVQVIDFLDPMADGYAAADLVVGRAGAITVAELCAWGLPSVLIPLPTAAADHQTHNARAMAEAGAALLLRQEAVTGGSLADAVEGLLGGGTGAERGRMAERALGRGRPDAAEVIAKRIRELVGAGQPFATSSSIVD